MNQPSSSPLGPKRSVRRRGPDNRHPYYARHTKLRRWEERLTRLLEHPEPAVRLWASFLNLAIKDLVKATAEVRLDAAVWFWSDCTREQVGSFRFVCFQLELDDPDQIRHDVFEDAHAKHGRQ